ncbi:hypothetical protein M378DRAFT_177815 [Amanita muscaria Koide BX008]|uniref:Uncharacterized protein n=1 Tax=Amanita muscaria (strain Koide BX008) TaxID=946122 RepID=A0A0C2SSV2_AMAMK|nr:hypothetical protein M378DRAFT_177815 [Amanita muscaria Koide BX008]
MSSFERKTGTERCTSWCQRHCDCQRADPVGSSQTRIDQGQHEPVNSDAREMGKETERNASKALQGKKARASDLVVQNRRRAQRAKGTEQSDARVVAELKQGLQEEKAKVSKMEEASQRQKQEAKGLEARLSQCLREKTEAFSRKETELNQRLREEREASRRKEKELNQRLEASRRKETELSQRLREEREASRRKEKGLEAKVTEQSKLNQRLQEETEASRRRERELNQRLREETEASRRKETELSQRLREEQEASRRKERESKRVIAELELRLREKTVKLSNIEASWRNSRKGESSEWLEAKVTELEAKLSGKEDDARRWEQKNRDLSETNQKQRDEINQLEARLFCEF